MQMRAEAGDFNARAQNFDFKGPHEFLFLESFFSGSASRLLSWSNGKS